MARPVAVLLGGLLLTAAALKLIGRDVSAVPQVGWFSAPWLQVAVAEWEILLGVWLISGLARRAAWLFAIITFVTFAVVSGTLGWQGVASCGCFGTIKASPWWAFGVDVVALILLARFRPSTTESLPLPRGVAVSAIIAILTLGLFATAGTLLYGSPAAALARLRGDELFVSPGFVAFGDGRPGDRLTAEVRIRNLSGRDLHLVGGTSDCSCVTTQSLPLTVPAGGEQVLAVELKLPDSDGAFTRTASIWTDANSQRTLRLRLGGRVTK